MASLPMSTGEDCKVLDTIKRPLKIVPPILYLTEMGGVSAINPAAPIPPKEVGFSGKKV